MKNKILSILLILISINIYSQNDELFIDINLSSPKESQPKNFMKFGDNIFFTKSTVQFGNEPWRFNLQTRETEMIIDLEPGSNSSNPKGFVEYFGKVFFSAAYSLYSTTGTHDGTDKVSSIKVYGDMLVFKDRLFFYGAINDSPPGLCFYNGTDETSAIILIGNNINLLSALNSKLIFSYDDGIHGRELWSSDGTIEGTHLEKDIRQNAGSSYPYLLKKNKNKLFFTASNNVNNHEVWVYDDDKDSTYILKDDLSYTGSNPRDLTILGQHVFYIADEYRYGECIWKSDGTTDGTHKVFSRDSITGNIEGLSVANEMIYFVTQSINDTIWKFKEEAIKKEFVHSGENLLNGQDFITCLDNKTIYYGYDNLNHGEPWVIDEDLNTATLLKEINEKGNARINGFINLDTACVFVATDGHELGYEFWVSKGTSESTYCISSTDDTNNGSYPSDFTIINNNLYFTADDDVAGRELWKTNGTKEETYLLKDFQTGLACGGNPDHLTVLGNKLFYTAYEDDISKELWVHTLNTDEHQLVKDIFPGSSPSNPHSLTVCDRYVYFLAKDNYYSSLWRTDGTTENTIKLVDNPQATPNNLVAYKNKVFFAQRDERGTELWSTDGTIQGTARFKDLDEKTSSTSPHSFIVVNDILYFLSYYDSALWRCDGTVDGTYKIIDSTNGGFSLYNVNNEVYVLAKEQSYSLYKLNINELVELYTSDYIRFSEYNYAISGEYFYFVANDESGNPIILKSNGTSDGTEVIPFCPSFDKNIYPTKLSATNDFLFFLKNNGMEHELWWSDGETFTILLTNTGYIDSDNGYKPIFFNNNLYFNKWDPQHGVELRTMNFISTSLEENIRDKKKTEACWVAHPNPTQDILTVECLSRNEYDFEIKIYDLTGNLIFHDINNTHINMQGLQTGTYILQIIDTIGIHNLKIMKIH